jgi:hypothetical protein
MSMVIEEWIYDL